MQKPGEPLQSISRGERQHGESKISQRIVVEAFLLVTWWAFRDRVLRRGRA